MSVRTLPVDGDTPDGWELNGSGATVARDAAPPLADNNNLTWFENTSTAPLDYMVRIHQLDDYASGDQITLHFAVSLETVDAIGVESEVFIFLQDGHPTDTSSQWVTGQFTNSPSFNQAGVLPSILDGTIYHLVWLYHPRPAGTGPGYGVAGKTLDDALALLASGNAWLDVNSLRALDGDTIRGRIYEAWIEVGSESTATPLYPLRRYPPVNNGGSGPTRHYPRAINRRAGGTY